jgi:GNAT superfamily N-acetyltransferase
MVDVRHEIPAALEYCSLRVDSGLSPMDPDAAMEALPRSLFAVTVRDGGELIGMGRVVGDGLHVQVVDIAVHPSRQGEGLSRLVLDEIVRFLLDLPDRTVISLFADVDWLYDKYGFAVPSGSTGMFLEHRDVARSRAGVL